MKIVNSPQWFVPSYEVVYPASELGFFLFAASDRVIYLNNILMKTTKK